MAVYLELFHGTKSPNWWELKRPGLKGPILGPLAYVRAINGVDLTCCPLNAAGKPNEKAAVSMQANEELFFYYDGVRYLEWSITDASAVERSKSTRRRIRQVEASKSAPLSTGANECAPKRRR